MHDSVSFNTLKHQAFRMNTPDFHLKHLMKAPGRLTDFSLGIPGFFFDFSRQRLDSAIRTTLNDLAKEAGAAKKFADMAAGKQINVTENRAALHTAARGFLKPGLKPDEPQILSDIQTVARNIRLFSEKIHTRRLTGTRKKAFTDAVVVGIGGSYLGCEFVYNALKAVQHPTPETRSPTSPCLNLHFLSNVDIDNFGQILSRIDPDTCLWIIVSKSFTTTETMANLAQVQAFLKRHHLNPEDHLVTITAKGSPGDDPANPVLASFHMFDFIGGRYSVTSAVGGVPLSLAFGYDMFERFLAGCARMDRHALEAPVEENIPLTAALISIWNIQVLGYGAQAIIPYSSALSKLPPHVQQVYMESLGKGVDNSGIPLPCPAGSIVFGEPGTNAQHSFFQLAHQGPAFPVEFIGVLTPGYTGDQATSKGVDNHQELWANLIAQTQALAEGRNHEQPAKRFSGNRPSSVVVIPDLSPESLGLLLSFYEARSVFEGFVLNINPFDQFGVELGKTMASGIRRQMADRNAGKVSGDTSLDPVTAFYLNALFKGRIDLGIGDQKNR
jgi:glucose-6-phosphate isomerase